MGEVDAVALDKTGTLTKGKLTVTDLVPLGDADEATLLRRAAALERRSEHPIASAILDRADRTGVTDHPEPAAFESLTGKGIRAEIDGETYYAGKPALFEDLGFDLSRARAETDGGVVTEGDDADPPAGDIGPSEFAEGTLAALEREGKNGGARRDGDTANGSHCHRRRGSTRLEAGGRAPSGTGREARRDADRRQRGDRAGDRRADRGRRVPRRAAARREGRGGPSAAGRIRRCGDGRRRINDAPALAAAEVGVAMGAAGTDTALETADIALMGDDVAKLPYLYALSHTANGVIRQNVWASLGVKALLALGVPLGLVSVAVAVVVGDMGMSLGVTGNAMRLSGIEPESFE